MLESFGMISVDHQPIERRVGENTTKKTKKGLHSPPARPPPAPHPDNYNLPIVNRKTARDWPFYPTTAPSSCFTFRTFLCFHHFPLSPPFRYCHYPLSYRNRGKQQHSTRRQKDLFLPPFSPVAEAFLTGVFSGGFPFVAARRAITGRIDSLATTSRSMSALSP